MKESNAAGGENNPEKPDLYKQLRAVATDMVIETVLSLRLGEQPIPADRGALNLPGSVEINPSQQLDLEEAISSVEKSKEIYKAIVEDIGGLLAAADIMPQSVNGGHPIETPPYPDGSSSTTKYTRLAEVFLVETTYLQYGQPFGYMPQLMLTAEAESQIGGDILKLIE